MEHPLTCHECSVHSDLKKITLEALPDDKRLFELAEIFKVFGDSTRIRIMCALLAGEMCVIHISEMLNISQSAISHQLRLLKNHRLVKYRRNGKNIFYSLDDEHISSILFQGLRHLDENE